MKCGNCGGEISLEDKVCPFCGNLNKDAAEHIRAMEEYKKRYKDTEEEVTKKTRKSASVTTKAVILTILIIGIGITALIYNRAYAFPEKARRKEALKHPEQCHARMIEYLDNGDYCAYAAYVAYNNIPMYDDRFDDLKNVHYCADYYMDTIAALERVVMHGDDEKWIEWSASNDTSRFCRCVSEFYDMVEERKEREENEKYKVYYDDMKAEVDAAMQAYLNMDEEARNEFLGMTDNKMSAYLEEVILGE